MNYLLEGVILGVSLLAIFVLIERVRIATGKGMLIDKLLAYLEDVYRRTAPKDKVQLIELYFHDTKSK